MGSLLLERDLRTSKEDSEVRTLVRARTLTVLGRLDPSRKTAVMQFLVEADLVHHVDGRDPIIGLSGADLSYANLYQAGLRGANLRGANLNEANLSDVNLSLANLARTTLSGTDLTNARVTTEQLGEAKSLKGATMPDGRILKSDDNTDGPTFEEWIKSKVSINY